jgi:hypothetical protein
MQTGPKKKKKKKLLYLEQKFFIEHVLLNELNLKYIKLKRTVM